MGPGKENKGRTVPRKGASYQKQEHDFCFWLVSSPAAGSPSGLFDAYSHGPGKPFDKRAWFICHSDPHELGYGREEQQEEGEDGQNQESAAVAVSGQDQHNVW